MAKRNHTKSRKCKKNFRPLPNNEPKPLIQAMDQEVIKIMLSHKNRMIDSFLEQHENVIQCINGECTHAKVGAVTRKLNPITNDDGQKTIGVIDLDIPLDVCGYTMSTTAHFIEYDLFRGFLSDEPPQETTITELSDDAVMVDHEESD